MKHFHCAAGDAIRLPKQHSSRLLFYDTRPDLRESRQLRGKSETRRPAAYDEDVDFFRDRAVGARTWVSVCWIKYLRVSGFEPIEMKLHGALSEWISMLIR
jgi:hypothetical protein